MYQDTGSSSSWANTASPRPQRLPVHNAHPAASTPPPTIANQAAVPKPLTTRWSAPAKPRITRITATASAATPLGPDDRSGSAHGGRRAASHERSPLIHVVPVER